MLIELLDVYHKMQDSLLSVILRALKLYLTLLALKDILPVSS